MKNCLETFYMGVIQQLLNKITSNMSMCQLGGWNKVIKFYGEKFGLKITFK